MKTILRALAVLILLCAPAQAAQKTKAQLTTTITTQLPSTGQGAITAAILRSVLQDIVDSEQQIMLLNQQTGVTYAFVAGDQGKLVTFDNVAPIAVTLPQGIGDFGTGYNLIVQNLGAGAVTITPTASTINGAATLVLNQNNVALIVSAGASVYRSITYGLMSSVTCGAGLSGGVITTTGTCDITDTISSNSSVGSATVVPILTYNSRGQLTTVTTQTISATAIGALLAANNLSDLTSSDLAKTNLGLAPIASSGSATDLSTGTVPAARFPALTGDVTSVAGTVATAITTNSVTYPKIQNVTASRVLGNPTTGATFASEISPGLTLLFSGTALQTQAGSGDITWLPNTFTTTISAGAVTLSKLAALPPNTAIGNPTASTSAAASMSWSQFTDTITNQQGSFLYRGSGLWSGILCANGEILASGGPGANPTCITVAGTGTVTQINQGAGLVFSPSPIVAAGTISADIATNSNIWSATVNKVVDAEGLNTAGAPVTVTSATTAYTINLSLGVDFSITLNATSSLANPTVTASQLGRTGCVYITQPTTTFYTLSYASNWKFAGGTAPTLTTTSSAVDALCYKARTTSFVWGTLSGANLR